MHEFKVVTSIDLVVLEENLNNGWKIDKVDSTGDILVYILSREIT